MVRLASALYEAGYVERGVLRGCYGADFPDELFVIALEAMRPTYFELDAECYFPDLPWNLVVPAAGEPMPERAGEVELELAAMEYDSRLVPVLETTNEYVEHGDAVLCHRLDELAEGRSTVFGCERAYDSERGDYFVGTEFVRYGDSLLSVLHEYTSDEVRRLTELSTAPWSRGADAILPEYIETARQRVRVVEALRCRLPDAKS